MTTQSDSPTRIERTVSIDAPQADIHAVLSTSQAIPEYWPGMTLSETDEAPMMTYTPALPEKLPEISLAVEPQVSADSAPTAVSMRFEGDLEGTIQWLLEETDESTHVSAAATIPRVSVADPPVDWEAYELIAEFHEKLPDTLSAVLENLKTLCEQPSPPASMATNVTIPEVYCPFSAEINPHLEDATAHTQEWAQEMGLINEPSSKIAILSYLVGRMYPQFQPEALRLCNDWNCWGFLLDDATDPLGPDQMQHAQQPLLAILDGEASGPHQKPLDRALADIHYRAAARMPPTWSERFAEHHRELFAGFRWEARNRETTTIPDYHAYIQNRQYTSGAKITFDLMAMDSSPLPTEVYQQKAVRSLREAAINVNAWINDVYSLQKELADSEINNLVVVIREEQGCSLQEAVTRTCELIEAETRRFEALSDRVTAVSDTEDDLQAYIMGMERITGGGLAWSKETERY